MAKALAYLKGYNYRTVKGHTTLAGAKRREDGNGGCWDCY